VASGFIAGTAPVAVNMTLPAFAAERRCCMAPAAINRYLLPAGRSAANPSAAAAAVDRQYRQTDGRTDTRPLHRPCSAHYAGSINKMDFLLKFWALVSYFNVILTDFTDYYVMAISITYTWSL